MFKSDDKAEFLTEDLIDGHLINLPLLAGSVPDSPFIIRTELLISVQTLPVPFKKQRPELPVKKFYLIVFLVANGFNGWQNRC
jgi:hypothetical protein